MNHAMRLGLFLSLLLMTVGCSRRVVADPETVASRNQPDWVVLSAPKNTPAMATAQPSPPPLPPPPPPPPSSN